MGLVDCEGGCACGAVRYRARVRAEDACHCHCESCRRVSGAPWLPWGTTEEVHFELLRGELALRQSSAHAMRGHCAACGTTLTYRNSHAGQELDITLCSLDQPALVPPQYHIWVQDKLPWVQLDDALVQYEQWREPYE